MDVPGIRAFVLMHVEDLQALAPGIHGKDVHGVAMTEAGGIEHPAVVVECRRAP